MTRRAIKRFHLVLLLVSKRVLEPESKSSHSMATPITPGVGARRNHLPKLPLSAFTASSTEGIPGAPPPIDPASIEPVSIIDAHFNIGSTADLSNLAAESTYASKLKGIVAVLSSSDGADNILAE